MASLQELLELEAAKKREELYRQTKKGPILQHPSQQDFLRNTPSIPSTPAFIKDGTIPPYKSINPDNWPPYNKPEEVSPQKEFIPSVFENSPELPSNKPSGRLPLPIEESSSTSDVGIASLIPQLNILGDRPEYNTDNPMMDELLNLSKSKKGSNEELAALFAGMTNKGDDFGTAVGSGVKSALGYRENQKARYLKALGLGAVRQDQINKTQYEGDMDWQIANREADLEVYLAQQKAAAKANLTSRDLQEAAATDELKAMADLINSPDKFWQPGEKEAADKAYQLRLIQRAIELKVGRPLPGGAADVTE